jgi:hypothetical protein
VPSVCILFSASLIFFAASKSSASMATLFAATKDRICLAVSGSTYIVNYQEEENGCMAWFAH